MAVLTTNIGSDGYITITDEIAKQSVQNRKAIFDKKGDSHYDNISAFIKSMRGSDPDAAIFYLARALNGGEDPMFLARRIVIAASEDVGMANPNALILATSAMEAVHMVGMPEARIILAEAAGIMNGDYILVKKQNTAENGEIVVALIDDEATVKTFYKEKDHIRLQPENSTMDPIIVPNCEILGKVAGVFRKL